MRELFKSIGVSLDNRGPAGSWRDLFGYFRKNVIQCDKANRINHGYMLNIFKIKSYAQCFNNVNNYSLELSEMCFTNQLTLMK